MAEFAKTLTQQVALLSVLFLSILLSFQDGIGPGKKDEYTRKERVVLMASARDRPTGRAVDFWRTDCLGCLSLFTPPPC